MADDSVDPPSRGGVPGQTSSGGVVPDVDPKSCFCVHYCSIASVDRCCRRMLPMFCCGRCRCCSHGSPGGIEGEVIEGVVKDFVGVCIMIVCNDERSMSNYPESSLLLLRVVLLIFPGRPCGVCFTGSPAALHTALHIWRCESGSERSWCWKLCCPIKFMSMFILTQL